MVRAKKKQGPGLLPRAWIVTTAGSPGAISLFDLRRGPPLVDLLIARHLDQLLLHAVLHLIVGRERYRPNVLEQDDVIAETGLHRHFGVAPLLHLDHRIRELLH